MSETGWPLIPREVLPAPIAAVRRAKRMPVHVDGGRQLSIFGAETTEPSPADLMGLLAGPGRLGRIGGTARVSVEVNAAWRVHVLVSELVARGLVVSWLPIHHEDQDQEDQDHEDQDREDQETPEIREIGPPESDDEPGGHTRADSPDGHQAAGSPGGRGPADEPAEKGELDNRAKDAERHAVREGSRRRGESDTPGGREGTPEGSDGAAVTGVTEDDGRVGGGSEQARDRPGPVVASFEVRTAYSSRLNGLARAWPPPPDRLFLSGPRLRLWVAAAGEPRSGGYALRLDPVDNPEIADSALVRAGLAGTMSDQGLYYLISGKKRLRRLAELVGERPPAAPQALWPGGATA